MIPYTDNLEHLLDELSRIDQVIMTYLETVRADNSEPIEFMGLYISEGEIQNLQKLPVFQGSFKALPDEKRKELEAIRKNINSKMAASLKQGTQLRFHTLVEMFGLDTFETDVLLIGLAPELDLKYEKIYSYLQNDVTRKRPGIDLVMNLLCPTMEAKLRSRTYFSLSSSLLKNKLIHLTGDGQNGQLPLISSFIKVDERIIGFYWGLTSLTGKFGNFHT